MKAFKQNGRAGIARRAQKGVTLIMVAGVLAILAAMGAGFYTLTISQNKSAVRYSDSVRADMMARAGMNDAIARLQEQAFRKTEDPTDPWYQIDWLNAARRHVCFPAKNTSTTGTGTPEQYASYSRSLGNSAGTASDRYSLDVFDTSGRINVNAGDNLGVLLDNLCRVIGPPLIASNLDAIQPRRWATEGAPAGLFDTSQNKDDNATHLDLYSRLDATKHQLADSDGNALYGDGYAIAGYRGRNGRFARLEDVKLAMSTVAHPGHPELEELERNVKFNAIRDYITIDSWVDTNTICVGKFEWSDVYRAIDRDKSWISSVDEKGNHIEDGQNSRGSLCGCYLSIINGHGMGQLRRIKENGIDWVQVDEPFVIPPGPTSAYMIISREDAMLQPKNDLKGQVQLDPNGHFFDDPNINYKRYPLCIHRAPVNINTASDKVLIAMFMGINVQHGTPLAIGTDADEKKIVSINSPKAWAQPDKYKLFPQGVPTENGLKRVPQDSGKPTLNRPEPWTDATSFGYIDNYRSLTPPTYLAGGGVCTEAHELAYRVIIARQARIDPKTQLPMKNDFDPTVPDHNFARGPFKSWDDFFFRVVQPWDDLRLKNSPLDPSTRLPVRFSLAPMIMAHFNSNTDLLKFNPNIEWIDRWGRNFTSMEPIMTGKGFNGSGQLLTGKLETAGKLSVGPIPAGSDQAAPPDPVLPKFLGDDPPQPLPNGNFYFIRNVRYRVNEMIDKSDMNRSTTEFTMDAGGVYEIHSIGQVVLGGEVRAERKLEALVQVYDVWRESTQRQFVEGHFSVAERKNTNGDNPTGRTDAGKITRDADNDGTKYLTLDTQPEPLVPLKYRLKVPNSTLGLSNTMKDYVDTDPKNANGNPKTPWPSIGSGSGYTIPDVIANRILPAGYDGQLVLASNTLIFDNKPGPTGHDDTFLASFNGDLDTDTCLGNGREQAKTPKHPEYRVCDTISLLGILNDNEIDLDSDSVEDIGGPPPKLAAGTAIKNNPIFLLNLDATTPSTSLNSFPTNPDRMLYEYCMSCRVGDLRPDGVYLGALGVSCKDATLKYTLGKGAVEQGNSKLAATGKLKLKADTYPTPSDRGGGTTVYHFVNPEVGGYNYEPGSKDGVTISMWVKSTWHLNDHQEHEFFNGSANGTGAAARENKLCKQGYVRRALDPTSPVAPKWSINNIWDGAAFYDGTLNAVIEDFHDNGAAVGLHAGTLTRDTTTAPYRVRPMSLTETPAFYVQPFRWAFVGQVHKMGTYAPTQANQMLGKATFSWGTGYEDPNSTGKDIDAFYNYVPGQQTPFRASTYNGAVKVDTFGYWEADEGYSTEGGAGDRTKAQTDAGDYARNIIRPFISTARNPEGAKFKTDNFSVISSLYPYQYDAMKNYNNAYNVIFNQVTLIPAPNGFPALCQGWLGAQMDQEKSNGDTGFKQNSDLDGQPAAYTWAQYKTGEILHLEACFSINNTNQGFAPFSIPPPPPPAPPRPVPPPYPYYPPGNGGGPPRPPPPPPPIPRPPHPFFVTPGKHDKDTTEGPATIDEEDEIDPEFLP